MHSGTCLRFIGGPLIQIGTNFTAVLDSYRLRLVIHCAICYSIFHDHRICDGRVVSCSFVYVGEEGYFWGKEVCRTSGLRL